MAMCSGSRGLLGALALLWLVALPVRAAGPEDEARALFERGLAASDARHWAEAADLFQRSRELVERPSTLFNLVGALYRLGRYREGLEVGAAYLRISSPEADRARRAEVENFLSEMQLAVGVLSISAEPRHASVSVDGRDVPAGAPSVALDPGRHELVVRASGHEERREVLVVERGARLERHVTLLPVSQRALPPASVIAVDQPAPEPARHDAPPPTTRQRRLRRALWITGSVLIVGGLTGLIVASQPEDARPEPTGGSTGITLPL